MAVKRVANAARQQFADLQSAYARLYNSHTDLQTKHITLQDKYLSLQDRYLALLVMLDVESEPTEFSPTIN